jgi:hypothetical protein
MRRIERILSRTPNTHQAFLLRPHQPGDLGWIVSRHNSLYWTEQPYEEGLKRSSRGSSLISAKHSIPGAIVAGLLRSMVSAPAL